MGLRGTSLAVFAGLVAIGLFAASPYLCDRLVGTGEAYNYSLAVADSVAQMRAGIVPPLAGQSIYAFNGRIHPLRNAPYMFYLAGAIDEMTCRHLTPWEIQNIALVMSLLGAGLACYIALRRGLECPPLASFLLSAVYSLSPALLGAAYSFDLFMTVHVAVFVPLAVGACHRSILRPSFSADAWLAATLAAAWLTHPPVALWLTAGAVFVRLAAFCFRPRWSTLISGTLAAALLCCLAAFVAVSALALNPSTGALTQPGGTNTLPAIIMQNVRSSFPATMLPVARDAGPLGSLQFGFVAWALMLWALANVASTSRDAGTGRARWVCGAASVFFASVLLVLTLPVPGVTYWLWRQIPGIVLGLTTIWPMQRLYLVATMFTVAAAALYAPNFSRKSAWPGSTKVVLVLIAGCWLFYEAGAFVARGDRDRRPKGETADMYRSSNIDITQTSYAYVGVPPTYTIGVDDPEFEFRLLRNGTQEFESNAIASVSTGIPVQTVSLKRDRPATITLLPGRRYVLTFDFKVPPVRGYLLLNGPVLRRIYPLPSSGSPAGFGMGDGQRRSIPLWTDSRKPEIISLRFAVPAPNTGIEGSSNFAVMTLTEINRDKLPVRLLSLSPLKFAVTAPQAGLTVETPRRFIPGYQAIVNGTFERPVMSPARQVMVPIPPGESVVELQCVGPASVVTAFWVSTYCWLGFFAWRLAGSWIPYKQASGTGEAVVTFAGVAARNWPVSLAAIACIAAVRFGMRQQREIDEYLGNVGPISIDFTLPNGQAGLSQPLLSSGRSGAGSVVFVHFIDEQHIRVEADVWGSLFASDPIETDFAKVQNIVISDSALFPTDHPVVMGLRPDELAQLRSEFKVELNGQVLIQRSAYAFETLPNELLIGHTNFVSNSDPEFQGEILNVRRLPIPREITVPGGQHSHLTLVFPLGRVGISEPLVAVTSGGSKRECYVTYLAGDHLRISTWSPAGEGFESAEVAYDPKAKHELDFAARRSDDWPLEIDLACQFDGKRLLGGDRNRPLELPAEMSFGLDAWHVQGVESRFTGPRLAASLVRDTLRWGPTETDGPVRLIVTFPSDKLTRHEPILATGRPGAGDLFYVAYVDGGHVRLGYDHWGVGGVVSEPIAINYNEPHEILIASNSLFERMGQAPSAPTTMLIDGHIAFSYAIAPYPTQQGEVIVARNSIGASSADPTFSGGVQYVERMGGVATPRTKL